MKFFYLLVLTIMYTTSSYCGESKSIKEISDRISALIALNHEDDSKIDKNNLYDPFKEAKPIIKNTSYKQKRVKSSGMNLQTTLNQRAFINSRWYSIGDKIQGYKIKSINKNSVVLSKNYTKKILKIQKTKDILNTTLKVDGVKNITRFTKGT